MYMYIYFKQTYWDGYSNQSKWEKREKKYFKKARCCCNGKVIISVKFPSVLYFTLHIKFKPGQEYVKCHQITGYFITLSLFFIITSF